MPTVSEPALRIDGHSSRGTRALLTALFFASGAVGLAYEVAWTRALLRVLGSTAAGSAIVLGVFVGALGVGARWAGARADRAARPLRAYGVLELLAALWALLFLPLLALLDGPFVAVASDLGEGLRWGVRLLVAVVLVGPGAFLLGSTLPFMVRAWPRAPERESRAVPWLYGMNTLGAVLGAWGTGFFLLEALGVAGALRLAVALGALVGALALFTSSRRRFASARRETAPHTHAPLARRALLAAVVCGFLSLATEVVGFRILTFFVEGFSTSFAAMLGVFILGLGLGSLVLGPWAARIERPWAGLRVLGLGLLAYLLLTGLVLLPRLEALLQDVRAWAYAHASGPQDLESGHRLVALAGALVVFLVPAFLLGPTFPLCVRWARAGGASEGRALGAVYLANSVGSLLGPLVVTFLLVPGLGLVEAWGVVLLLVLVAWTTLRSREEHGRVFVVLRVLLAAAIVFALWPVARGADDQSVLRWSHVLARKPDRTLLAVESDSVTTASVIETADGERILYTDDFAAAATGPQYRYMRLLGHLPALLAQRQENAFVIAFGTGTTAGAVARHPGVQRLEVAELSRAVIEMAPYFNEVHGGVLEDPRTRLLVDDGREALLLHAPDLDIITLEPLMPYSPAGLPFYTREFYELARDRLREGGVVCQWVPVHAMRVGLYEALLKTFYEVFPDGTLWFFEQSTALIGRKGGAPPPRDELATRFAAAQAHLAEAGYPSLDLLESACVADGRAILARRGQEPGFSDRRVTDLDPWPEFHATPRGVLTSYLTDTLAYLATLAVEAHPVAPLGGEAAHWERMQQGAETALKARAFDARAQHLGLVAPRGVVERLAALDEAAAGYGRALERLSGEQALTWRRARALREAAEIRVRSLLAQAQASEQAGRADEAGDLRRSALGYATAALAVADGVAAWSRRGPAATAQANALLSLGRCAAAEKTLSEAQAALGATPEGRQMGALLAAVRARSKSETVPGRVQSWGLTFPPCRVEGLEPVRALFEAWSKARDESTPPRAVRLAAKNLVIAAYAEGAEGALLDALRALPLGSSVTARAQRAVLLRLLDSRDPALEELLAAGSVETVSAALAEAAAHKLPRRFPAARLSALGASVDPAIRTALLEAIVEDGDLTLLPHAVALLNDEVRGVRTAAAAAVLPHDPQELRDYDPDQPGTWGRVQKRLTR